MHGCSLVGVKLMLKHNGIDVSVKEDSVETDVEIQSVQLYTWT